MKHTIMCYQHASADYILDIINILKLDRIQITPMWALRDFTINHSYIRTLDYNIFTPGNAADVLLYNINYLDTMGYEIIYLTHDITYMGINRMNVGKLECDHCGYSVDISELKQYSIKSTGEQFAICRKCINDESNIC